jgi:hypothetical protein
MILEALLALATLAAPGDFTDTVRSIVVRADPAAVDACIDLKANTVKPIDGMIWSLYCQSLRLEQPATFLKRMDQLDLCWNTASRLSEAAPNRPESFYFAGLCLADKSYTGGVVSQIATSRQVLRLFDDAISRGTDKHPVVARAKMAKALFVSRLPGRHDDPNIDVWANEALRGQPNLARLKVWYAQSLEERGRLVEAFELLKDVLAKAPEETAASWEASLLDRAQAESLLKQWRSEARENAAPRNQETTSPAKPR